VNGVYQAQNADYLIAVDGTITFTFVAPAANAVLLISYWYQATSPSDPWNVLVTLNSGPDAFEVTEGTPHTTLAIACPLERRQKTFRQRLRGGWFSLVVANSQPGTYFCFESAMLEFHDSGRNRERR
jgi:hypothetical protein